MSAYRLVFMLNGERRYLVRGRSGCWRAVAEPERAHQIVDRQHAAWTVAELNKRRFCAAEHVQLEEVKEP